MTASAHVLVFRPLISILRGRGDEVRITARDYAQTLQLLKLHGLEADAVIGKARRPLSHGQSSCDVVPPSLAAELGTRPRLRRRARARLA